MEVGQNGSAVKPISIGGNSDGSINFDELAEKFRNFYIYPKKDKARFFQDGVDGEYDASKSFDSKYTYIVENGHISSESNIIGTANVQDYFEVSDIEVLKLLAIVFSRGVTNRIGLQQNDASKLLADYSTDSNCGIQSDTIFTKEIQDISICYAEYGDDDVDTYPYFGVVLTPEDYTKFYVLDVQDAPQ